MHIHSHIQRKREDRIGWKRSLGTTTTTPHLLYIDQEVGREKKGGRTSENSITLAIVFIQISTSNVRRHYQPHAGSSNSNSSSSRTDRWTHFQLNAGLRLFVHTWIMHGIDDCYQLTLAFEGFCAQCLSKLFLKDFTVLLLTTSLG